MPRKQKGFKLNFGPQHPSAKLVLRTVKLISSKVEAFAGNKVKSCQTKLFLLKKWKTRRFHRLHFLLCDLLFRFKKSKIFRLLSMLFGIFRWVGRLLDLESVRFKLGLLLFTLNLTLAAVATGILLMDPCFLSFIIFSMLVWLVSTMISIGIVGWSSQMWVDTRFVVSLFQILGIPIYGDLGGLCILWSNRHLVMELLAAIEFRAVIRPVPGGASGSGGNLKEQAKKWLLRLYGSGDSNIASAMIHPPLQIIRSPDYMSKHPFLSEWFEVGARIRKVVRLRTDEQLMAETLLTKRDLAVALSKNRTLTDRILNKPTRKDAIDFLTKFVGVEKLVTFKLHQDGYHVELNEAIRKLRKDPAFVFASGDLPNFSEFRSGSDFVFSVLADSPYALPVSYQHSSVAGSPDFSVVYLDIDRLCNDNSIRAIDEHMIISKRTAELKFSSYRNGQPLSKFLDSVLNSKANLIVLASHHSFEWMHRFERIVWAAWSSTGGNPNASLYDSLVAISPWDLPTDQTELDYIRNIPASRVVSGYLRLREQNTAVVGLQIDFNSIDFSVATQLAERQYRRGELLLSKFGESGITTLNNLARTGALQVSLPKPKFHLTSAIPDHRLLSAYQLAAMGHESLAAKRTLGSYLSQA